MSIWSAFQIFSPLEHLYKQRFNEPNHSEKDEEKDVKEERGDKTGMSISSSGH